MASTQTLYSPLTHVAMEGSTAPEVEEAKVRVPLMSAATLRDIPKHDDDMLMLMILMQAGIAVVQTLSVLLALYDIYKVGYLIYAGVGLAFYMVLPLIFVIEDAMTGKVNRQSMPKVYLERAAGYGAIMCCHKAWQHYRQTLSIKELTLEECQKSHWKVREMRELERAMLAGVRHQKFEGMIALVTNTLVTLDSSSLPPLALVPAVVNTAKAYAEYDFAGKVTLWMDDGKIPVVAGTVDSWCTKALLLLARLFELGVVVLASCVAHMTVKQSFTFELCPIIVLLPTAFLCATVLAAKRQRAQFSWAEAFAGLFCFSGPLTLPWDVAYVNCSAASYYSIRITYLTLCGVLSSLAVMHRKPDEFTMEVLQITAEGLIFLLLLLALIKKAHAAPKMPQKVLPVFIEAVAKSTKYCYEVEHSKGCQLGPDVALVAEFGKALPKDWVPFEELLRHGYGVFRAVQRDRLSTGGAEERAEKQVLIQWSEWRQEWERRDDYTELFANYAEHASKVIDFVGRNKGLSKVTLSYILDRWIEGDRQALAKAIAGLPKLKVLEIHDQAPCARVAAFMASYASHVTEGTLAELNVRRPVNATHSRQWLRKDDVVAVTRLVEKQRGLEKVQLNLAPTLSNMQEAVKWLHSPSMSICWGEDMGKGTTAWKPCAKDLGEVAEVNLGESNALGDEDSARVLGHILRAAASSTRKVDLRGRALRSAAPGTLKTAVDVAELAILPRLAEIDLRDNDPLLVTAAAGAALARLWESSPELERLDLASTGLAPEALERLAEELPVTKVKDLRLHANAGLLGTAEAGAALARLYQKLPELSETLNLSGTGATPEALLQLAEEMPAVKVKDLNLCGNRTLLRTAEAGASLAKLCEKLPELAKLNLDGTGLTPEALRQLAEELPVAKVKDLNLDSNPAFAEEAAAPLAKLCQKLPELETLDLMNTRLTPKALAQLAEELPVAKVKALHLYAIDDLLRTEEAGAALAKLCRKLPELETLVLQETGATPEALKQLAEELPVVKVKTLNLAANEELLRTAEAGAVLAKLCQKLPELETLNLHTTGASPEALKQLAEELPVAKVKNLRLCNSKELLRTEEAIEALAKLCQKLPELEMLNLDMTGCDKAALERALLRLEKGPALKERVWPTLRNVK